MNWQAALFVLVAFGLFVANKMRAHLAAIEDLLTPIDDPDDPDKDDEEDEAEFTPPTVRPKEVNEARFRN